MKFIFTVVKRYIFNNQSYFSYLISVISVALSSFVIISMFFILKSVNKSMTKKMLGFNGHVYVYSDKNHIPCSSDTVSFIENIVLNNIESSKIKSIFPVVKKQVVILGKKSIGAILNGMKTEDMNSRPIISECLSSDQIKELRKTPNGVFLGRSLLQKSGLKAGDEVSIICPLSSNEEGNEEIIPNVKKCKVLGSVDLKLDIHNDSCIISSIDFAQEAFDMDVDDECTFVEVFIDDPSKSDVFSSELNSYFSKTNQFNSSFNATDWKFSNKSFLEAINIQSLMVVILFFFIILMSALAIIGNILHLVKRKKREIAILRTIGAKKSQILKIFLSIGLVMFLVGTSIGVFLSYLFISNITVTIKFLTLIFSGIDLNLIENASFDWVIMWRIYYVMFLIIFVTILFPAFQAARISPSEALKHD